MCYIRSPSKLIHVYKHTHKEIYKYPPTHTHQWSQWTMPEPSTVSSSAWDHVARITHCSHTSSSQLSCPHYTITQVAICGSRISIPALLLSDISSKEESSSSSRKIRWLTRLFNSDGSHWWFSRTANLNRILMGDCLGLPLHIYAALSVVVMLGYMIRSVLTATAR